jgi:hypothetical protein
MLVLDRSAKSPPARQPPFEEKTAMRDGGEGLYPFFRDARSRRFGRCFGLAARDIPIQDFARLVLLPLLVHPYRIEI